MTLRQFSLSLVAALAVTVAGSAVADDVDDLQEWADSQTQCETDSDCHACQRCLLTNLFPLSSQDIEVKLCFFSDCTLPCLLDSDCDLGEICNVQAKCQKAPPCIGDGCPCGSNLDCDLSSENPTPRVCDLGTGVCITPDCETDFDCPLAEECADFRCVVDLDADRDRDGVPDAVDNCRAMVNTDQDDLDNDGDGDVCDVDIDGDGRPNRIDNCPMIVNPIQRDRDGDGIGDPCESDLDADGVPDDIDNCTIQNGVTVAPANPSQRDTDGDGLGDACDADDDDDGVLDIFDACPLAFRTECTTDSDGDGLADGEDSSAAPIDPGVDLPGLP